MRYWVTLFVLDKARWSPACHLIRLPREPSTSMSARNDAYGWEVASCRNPMPKVMPASRSSLSLSPRADLSPPPHQHLSLSHLIRVAALTAPQLTFTEMPNGDWCTRKKDAALPDPNSLPDNYCFLWDCLTQKCSIFRNIWWSLYGTSYNGIVLTQLLFVSAFMKLCPPLSWFLWCGSTLHQSRFDSTDIDVSQGTPLVDLFAMLTMENKRLLSQLEP